MTFVGWDESCFPPIGDQCRTEACVSWAVGYYAKTFFHHRRPGGPTVDVRTLGPGGWVSPSWVHNLINHGYDEAQTVEEAMAVTEVVGVATIAEMPITCDPAQPPSGSVWRLAVGRLAADPDAPLRSPRRFRRAEGSNEVEWPEVRKYLRETGPVVFWLQTDRSFRAETPDPSPTSDRRFYAPGDATVSAPIGAGGPHAIVCIGYDEDKALPDGGEGAYRFLNSYGTSWRDGGAVWIGSRWLESTEGPLFPQVFGVEELDSVLDGRPWDRIRLRRTAADARQSVDNLQAGEYGGPPRYSPPCDRNILAEEACPALRARRAYPIQFRDGELTRWISGPWIAPTPSKSAASTRVFIDAPEGVFTEELERIRASIQRRRRPSQPWRADRWRRHWFPIPRELLTLDQQLRENAHPSRIQVRIAVVRPPTTEVVTWRVHSLESVRSLPPRPNYVDR